MALFYAGESFTAEQKARDFAYYEPLTVRDSSLSACIQAVVAAEVGHVELAYDYFAEAALLDLDDLEHNTRDGVHIASHAGACIAALAAFGGLRDHGGALSFTPRLPQALTRIAFSPAHRSGPAKAGAQTEHSRSWPPKAPAQLRALTQKTHEPPPCGRPVVAWRLQARDEFGHDFRSGL